MQVLTYERDILSIIDELDQLGLSRDLLKRVIEEAAAAKNSVSPHHPNNSGGTYAWHEGVRALRDQLSTIGWKPMDIHNKALTINETATVAIDICGGNSDTGLIDGNPQSRNPRGNKTRDLIHSNQQQLFPFNFHEIYPIDETPVDRFQTWVLLYFFDARLNQVRYELSLPCAMEGDRIYGWSKRIICEPIKFEVNVEDSKAEFNDNLDIDVTLRTENE